MRELGRYDREMLKYLRIVTFHCEWCGVAVNHPTHVVSTYKIHVSRIGIPLTTELISFPKNSSGFYERKVFLKFVVMFT